jgi:hypothetical protein
MTVALSDGYLPTGITADLAVILTPGRDGDRSLETARQNEQRRATTTTEVRHAS